MKLVKPQKIMAAALLIACVAAPAAGENQAPSSHLLYIKGKNALEAWHYKDAQDISVRLFEFAAETDEEGAWNRAYLFRAHYCFYLGDYECSKEALDNLSEMRELDQGAKRLHERVTTLAEVWDGATYRSSEHFRVRIKPGKDEVLAKPALDTLEKSYDVLTKDFHMDFENPVLVEVYPRFEHFSAATGLSMEALENSGTIAVCKYRRLMINTPRSTVRGYAYRDTLSHEFVHFLIYEKYGDAIPIWLHEGLAKYEEARWRGDRGGELTPSQQSLLASALRQGELISFERMHPSFAYLKTPSQGQLAFAEVTTVVGYLIEKGGWESIFKLADELASGADYREAIRKVTGTPFDRFWEDWQSYARSLELDELPGMEISAFEIRKGEEEMAEVDEDVQESDIREGEHWKWVLLGDLLRDRGRYRAAAVEYERAKEKAPYSPRILNKLGLCCYLAEDYEKGLEHLKLGTKVHPGYSTTYVNMGRTLFAMEKYKEAEEAFHSALDINPFNPIPYKYLIKIYREAGDDEKADAVISDLRTITG